MICFHSSGNVENHHLNCACQCCAQHNDKFFIIWTSKAVYDKACVKYAILHVKAASQKRVIISIMTVSTFARFLDMFSCHIALCCVSCKIATRQKHFWYKFKKLESVI